MPNFNLPDIIERGREREQQNLLSQAATTDEGGFHEETQAGVESATSAPQLQDSSPPKPGVVDYGADIAMMGPRAAEGFAEGVWGLLDWVTGDRLWDWDRKENNLFGRSKTIPGMLGEGILQFATGFIPGIGIAGKIGKVTKVGKVVDKSGDLLSKGVIQHSYRGNRTLKLSTLRKIKNAKPKARRAAQFAAAGAMADFVAFKGEEARLSNLLIGHKGEDSNTILEYLAYDPSKDNNEIEERFKNVVEGFFVGGALTGVLVGGKAALTGLRSVTKQSAADGLKKTFKIFRDKGKIVEKQRARGEEVDEVAAYAEAVEMNPIKPSEQKALNTVESEVKDAQAAEAYEATTKRKISEEERPEAVTRAKEDPALTAAREVYERRAARLRSGEMGAAFSTDELLPFEEWVAAGKGSLYKEKGQPTKIKAAKEERGVAIKEAQEAATAKERPEPLKPIRRADGTPFKTAGGAKAAITKLGKEAAENYTVKEVEGGGFEAGPVKAADEAPAKDVVPEPEAPKYTEIDVDKATEDQLDDWINDNLGTSMRASDVGSKRDHVKDIIKAADAEEHVLLRMEAHAEQKIKELGLFDETNPQAAYGAINVVRSMPELRAMISRVVKMGVKASAKRGGAAKGIPKNEKEVAEMLEKTANLVGRGVEALGGNKAKVLGKIQALRLRPNDLAIINKEAQALWGFLGAATDDVRIKVNNAVEAHEKGAVLVKIDGEDHALSPEQALTELASAQDRFLALDEMWSDWGTQLSLGMRQRNDLYVKGYSSIGRDIAGQNRSIGYDALTEGKTAQKLYRNGVRSTMRESKYLKKLAMAAKTDNLYSPKKAKEAMEAAVDTAMANRFAKLLPTGRKAMGVTQEWFINALLGSPTTWVVNIVGNGLVMALRHFEITSGALLTGNTKLLRANFRTLFDIHGFMDSVKYAVKAGWDDEAKSIAGHTAYSDNRIRQRGEIHVDNPDGNSFYTAINWLGKAVRHPTRILMAGDEFFKQMHFRAHTKTMLAMEGYEKGLHKTPKALAEFVDTGFEGLITTQGRFRNEANVLREAHDLLATKRKGGDAVVNEREFIAKHMDKHFNQHNIEIEDGTLYSAKDFGQRAELVQQGTDWALVNTFTNNPTNPIVKQLGQLATFSPWLTFVVPFVRTPSNIITFALGRTVPLGAMSKMPGLGKRAMDKAAGKDVNVYTDAQLQAAAKEYHDMPNADLMIQEKLELINRIGSVEAAEYTGRLAFSGLAAGSVWLLAEGIKDKITGAAPESRTKRASWEAAGKQPYSIKLDLGDGEQWHSYQRLDPFATILGIWMDIMHGTIDTREGGEGAFGDEEELEEKRSELNRVFGVTAMAFANNVTNKSYVEGLASLFDLLRKPDQTFEQVGGGILAGFVPNGLNASQNVFQEDPAILESRGLLDKLMKKLPEDIRPKKLMPRRNFLGEIKRKQHTGGLQGVLNPIFRHDVSNDIVDLEIESHGVGKGNMTPMLSVGGEKLNMHEYTNENAQTAYDRVQELSGTIKLGSKDRTLRQTLRAIIESDDYQRLPDVTEQNAGPAHPRTKLLSKAINLYRAHAKRQMFKEFKALRNKYATLLQ